MENSPSGDLRLTPARNLIEAAELLYSLPGVDLGRVHVALRVHGNVVDDVELTGESTGTSDAADHFVGRSIDDAHLVVHAIDHIDQRLLAIG